MIYSLKNKNYCTFEIFEKNKLPPRAYFIPFSDKRKAMDCDVTEARYRSDLVTCLSGEWDFRFYKDPKTLEDEFDTDSLPFDKISVPSVWQYTGYLDPMYINSAYPFSFDPPRVPEGELGRFKNANNRLGRIDARGQFNSVGVYRKKFFVNDTSKTISIAFLGVSSCLDLFVNGSFVGYSEGSHNTAEFLLDKFVRDGENELVAVVHRFSTGTYLEAQDMFRNNGIFRDVLLYQTEKEHIDDYELKTTFKDNGTYDMTVSVAVGNAVGGTVKFTFSDRDHVKEYDKSGKAEFILTDLKIKEWSAETPNLYPVTISLNEKEFIAEKMGFKRIEIKGDTFFFNGKKIKLFGVNHHDTHPEKGYAMSIEDVEKDILLMKEYNVNAVRTSHYPPDPVFIRLCDKYGLYVIDEADIETHGACACGDVGKISKNPAWKEHYLDRVKRMFYRDRNDCSVTMWSLGNESGGIYCQQYCNDYLKSVTDIPVHYEGACREKIVGFDVVSEMYTSIKHMKKNAALRDKDARRNKPYFLCEYCHAMGLGPGGLSDYIELFLSDDIYLGGCIWEWADHSVYHKDTGNYTYGGDHNEYRHDGNFCIDGLFRPDRKPYTSALLMKVAYRPVRAKHLGDGKVEFYNVNRFRSTEYLGITANLSVDGIIGKETLRSFILPPEGKTVLTFSYPVDKDVFLNVTYVDKASGNVVAEEQVALNEVIPSPRFVSGKPTYERNGKILTIKSDECKIAFDLSRGSIVSYYVDGKDLVADMPRNRLKQTGIYPEIYRAPTDNDSHVKILWRILGLHRYKIIRVKNKITFGESSLTLQFSYNLVNILLPIAKITDRYTVFADGVVRVESTIKFYKKPFIIPRVGKTMELKRDFDRAKYYGRGEQENYPDMKEHAKVGIYEQRADFAPKIIVPQTGGEKCDVRWAEITDESGTGIRIEADKKAFMLNVNHFSDADICKWKHIVDYKDGDTTFVNVDGFMGGIGSNSCGPLPEEKYYIPQGKPLTYSFVLRPLSSKK